MNTLIGVITRATLLTTLLAKSPFPLNIRGHPRGLQNRGPVRHSPPWFAICLRLPAGGGAVAAFGEETRKSDELQRSAASSCFVEQGIGVKLLAAIVELVLGKPLLIEEL